MKTRHALACLVVVLTIALWRLSRPADRAEPPVVTTEAESRPPSRSPVIASRPAGLPPRVHWTRAEAATHLLRYFSKEQLGLELELEQDRYRGQYWQAEPGLAELQSIETRRTAALRRLTAEMNATLAEMFPGETGEPLALAPFFSLDHPAPNLAFLSDDSRQKIEAALLDRDPGNADDPMQVAAALLSGQERAEYARWNAPPAAALRNRLAGFDASEGEFNAILEWQAAAGSDRETAARAVLATQLGADRLAQLDRLNEPALHTATQDLQRLGLPIEDAGWLAQFRQQATAQLQRTWSKSQLSDAEKQTEVAALHTAFRMELASQLKPPAESDDLLP